MLRFLPLAALATLLTFVACEDENPVVATTGDLNLLVNATFDDEPLELDTRVYTYSEAMGFDLRLNRFDFYASDLTLVGANGAETELDDIDLWDFTGETVRRSYVDLPTGDYSAIKIGIGVPQAENGAFCNDCATTDPLADAGHWWQNWSSYIFAKIEGQLDTNGDGVTDDAGIVYHSGTDALYQTVTLPVDLEVMPDGSTTLALGIDIKELFRLPTGMIDLQAVPATHTDQQLANTKLVMDNFQTAFSVEE